eukprot:215124-Amorphochlora_amoeboformis.AAC.2
MLFAYEGGYLKSDICKVSSRLHDVAEEVRQVLCEGGGGSLLWLGVGILDFKLEDVDGARRAEENKPFKQSIRLELGLNAIDKICPPSPPKRVQLGSLGYRKHSDHCALRRGCGQQGPLGVHAQVLHGVVTCVDLGVQLGEREIEIYNEGKEHKVFPCVMII